MISEQEGGDQPPRAEVRANCSFYGGQQYQGVCEGSREKLDGGDVKKSGKQKEELSAFDEFNKKGKEKEWFDLKTGQKPGPI